MRGVRQNLFSLRLQLLSGLVALFIVLAVPVYADVPFLMVFQERGWRQWTVIPLALLIELLVLRYFFKMSWKRGIVADLAMNAASTLVGIIPTSGPLGIAADVISLLRIYMFSGVAEIAGTIVVVAFIDTVVEYAVLRLAFSQKWTFKRGLALLAANLVTGGIILGSFSLPSSLAGIFGGVEDGYPASGLAIDSSGAIYGGTIRGRSGNGLIYKLTPLERAPARKWHETILYDFAGGTEGAGPQGLIFDQRGTLYGTTQEGGEYGGGTIFKLTRSAARGERWTLVTLHSFESEGNRGNPLAGLTLDNDGALVGATNSGVVFRLAPPASGGESWTYTTIYRFSGGSDGDEAGAHLVVDKSGSVYGVTSSGGALGKGSVFKLTRSGREGENWRKTVLYSCPPLNDGRDGFPFPDGLVFDGAGALYGVTQNGGAMSQGSVFRLLPPTAAGQPWTETTLYSFDREKLGHGPLRIFFDKAGALYGVTFRTPYIPEPAIFFKLASPAGGGAPWRLTVLYEFSQREDDEPPIDFVLDTGSMLYGTTLGVTPKMIMLAPRPDGRLPWNMSNVHKFRDR